MRGNIETDMRINCGNTVTFVGVELVSTRLDLHLAGRQAKGGLEEGRDKLCPYKGHIYGVVVLGFVIGYGLG